MEHNVDLVRRRVEQLRADPALALALLGGQQEPWWVPVVVAGAVEGPSGGDASASTS
jgi:hypothetical protein